MIRKQPTFIAGVLTIPRRSFRSSLTAGLVLISDKFWTSFLLNVVKVAGFVSLK